MSAAPKQKPKITRSKSGSQITPQRRSLLARIHIAKKELGLDDDIYRDCIELVTGQRSASKLTIVQLRALIEHFQSKGWSAKASTAKNPSSKAGTRYRSTSQRPMVRKIYVLWKILFEAGKVKVKRPDGYAKRMTKTTERPDGVANVEWLSDEDAYAVIEGLKNWITREGLDYALNAGAKR